MHVPRNFFIVICLSILLSACQTPEVPNSHPSDLLRSEKQDKNDFHILVIADTHLDPFVDPKLAAALDTNPPSRWEKLATSLSAQPFASFGHDTNASLFFSSLAAVHEAVPHPDAIFVGGDLLAHHFREHFLHVTTNPSDAHYEQVVDATVDLLADELHALYPGVQILPTVGNNDGYCGDYESTPRDTFLARQATVWEPLVNIHQRAPMFHTTYARGGYYEASLGNGLHLISLNSVLFSDNYENACGDPIENPAQEELSWFSKRLTADKKTPTLLLTHIPPGIDGFKSFLHLGKAKPFYHEQIQQEFFSTLNAQHNVTAMVTGHLHNVAYRMIMPPHTDNDHDENIGIPVFSAPSISPIFGNAPSFTQLDITSSGAIADIMFWTLESSLRPSSTKPHWRFAYDFNDRYHLAGVTTRSIRRFHVNQYHDYTFRNLIEHDRVGGGPAGAIGRLNWHTSWCTELALNATDYLKCQGLSDHAADMLKQP